MSFRLRVFLLAFAVAASAALVASLFIGARVQAFEAARRDAQLCMEARRLLRQDSLRGRLLEDIGEKLRVGPDQLWVHVDLGFQPLVHGWPADLQPDALNWRAAEEEDRPGRRCAHAEWRAGQREWRAARVDGDGGRAIVAVDLAASSAELDAAMRAVWALVLPLVLVSTALGAWLLTNLTMRPLVRLREAMQALTPQALDQRLPEAGADVEFRALVRAYNVMLERLERSFRQASRFSADAAHELRTPLTVLQGRLEQAIHASSDAAMQAQLAELLEEVDRLGAITRHLLLLAQADAGHLPVRQALVDLSALLLELVEDARMLLSDARVQAEIEPALQIRADALLLRQMLNNLVANAARYSVGAAPMQIHACRRGSQIEVRIRNPCAPISATQRAQLFDRFYRVAPRVDAAGSGLGLSLAREIARAHGGDLRLADSAEDVVEMHLLLPA